MVNETVERSEEEAQVEETVPTDNTEPGATGQERKRENQRSTIAFPYNDLDDAVQVAEAIAGSWGTRCSFDALAPQLGHDNVGSGSFRLKLSAARVFGLIETDRDIATLTDLGRRAVQPLTGVAARAQAFLNVPLYKALFEQYKGYTLPRDVGLEQEMVRLGVATKQADKARQAFQRSAMQAGFFAHGRERLVQPAVGANDVPTSQAEVPGTPAPSLVDERPTRPQTPVGGGDGPTGIDPFIEGLFRILPPAGAKWSIEKRKLWLETAERVFGLIYSE